MVDPRRSPSGSTHLFFPPRRSGAEDAELLFLAYVSLFSVRAERLWKSQQAFTRRLRGFQINRF